jgi:capsular polysaccharide biosynthesis protein/Mrp family chromosome partitioning ATPase
VITVLTALATAAVLLQTLPKKYAAEADVQVTPIQSSDQRFVGLGLLQESNESRSVLTAARYVRSPQVARAVADKIGGNPDTLLAEIQAQPQGQSNILTVAARAGTPDRAEQVANTFTNTMLAQREDHFQRVVQAQIKDLKKSLARGQVDATDTQRQLNFLESFLDKPDPTLRVASAAVASNHAVSPRKKLVLVVVALAALLLAGVLLFALELLDPRVREERQVAEAGKPILARLPRITRRAATHLLRGDRVLPANVLSAYRLLADKLFEGDDGRLEEPTVLLVAATPASLPQENLAKTVTAVNVAALAASAGRRTIIVNADSLPETIRAFEVDGAGPDLGDLLSGADHRDVIRPVPGSHGSLSIVPSSSNGSNYRASDSLTRIDLFGNRAVARAFEQLRSAADVIVVSAPAVTDAAELIPFAKAADRVVIDVELGVTSQGRLDALMQTFDEQGAEISGFVLFIRGRGRGTGGRLTYARTVAQQPAASTAVPRQRRRRRPSVANKPQSLETNG